MYERYGIDNEKRSLVNDTELPSTVDALSEDGTKPSNITPVHLDPGSSVKMPKSALTGSESNVAEAGDNNDTTKPAQHASNSQGSLTKQGELAKRGRKGKRASSKQKSSSSSSDESATYTDFLRYKRWMSKKKAAHQCKIKSKASESDSDASSSTTNSDSTSSGDVVVNRKNKRNKKVARSPRKKAKIPISSSESSSEMSEFDEETQDLTKSDAPSLGTFTHPSSHPHPNPLALVYSQLAALQVQPQQSPVVTPSVTRGSKAKKLSKWGAMKERKENKVERGSKAEFVRLDRVYSRTQHQWITQPSQEGQDVSEYEGYAFNIVRHFDYQEREENTSLRILSPYLMTALKKVMGNISGVSLDDINSNLAFLFLDDLKACRRDVKRKAKGLKVKSKKQKQKAKELDLIGKHVKVLTKYLDKDYKETQETLEPLLRSGKITFDLTWALFKSNEMLFTNTYDNEELPRAVTMTVSEKTSSILEGEAYMIETRFMEYDGKRFGTAEMDIKIKAFQGARQITSLPVYPLKYHPNANKLRKQLIERGKKFVELAGMHYKMHSGMAYMKKDRKVLRIHVDGRVMLDPATFRRLCPNYAFSSLKPPDPDLLPDSPCCSSGDEDVCDDESFEGEYVVADPLRPSTSKQEKGRMKWEKKHFKKKLLEEEDSDEPGTKRQYVDEVFVPSDEEEPMEAIDKVDEEGKLKLNDDDYLIASPVILGFSFGEKLWLEFSVDAIGEIVWNEGAFNTLIIPDDQKMIVKALVQSHDQEANKNIDDIIRGKGKGLVAVLHGPPGTGKTLTAEGIADLLKKPLYSVSAGDLGTSPTHLERNLSQILEVAHTWKALLLLDEADVFLEARTNYDVTRNALVSIFLRLLEYFEGILFLTTNRVAVFDDAFASRVHIGLRYGGLELKARKKIWGVFLDRVRDLGHKGVLVEKFDEDDMGRLAGFELNGREIKNAVRTAQSVASINGEKLGMKQLLSVLVVGNVFAKDLRGQGYEDALRLYM